MLSYSPLPLFGASVLQKAENNNRNQKIQTRKNSGRSRRVQDKSKYFIHSSRAGQLSLKIYGSNFKSKTTNKKQTNKKTRMTSGQQHRSHNHADGRSNVSVTISLYQPVSTMGRLAAMITAFTDGFMKSERRPQRNQRHGAQEPWGKFAVRAIIVP